MIEMLHTHPYVSGMHEEYFVDWCGKLIDCDPVIKNHMPIFIIISSTDRYELNTLDIKRIEDVAKTATKPHGRAAVTTDTARIYILERDGNQQLMGTVTHNHVKEYRQMYDAFEKI